MTNIALLIGNSNYSSQTELACCANDVVAMKALLEATEKFNKIKTFFNIDADGIRSAVRTSLEEVDKIEEFYFYFSGHGIQIKSEFFYCGTKFDASRPNETGLSNTDLHSILRSCSPNLVVKVIDACNSGTTLIKADVPLIEAGKGLLKDVIQIASCQNSQFSLAGNPLSLFTKHFCQAAFRKDSGPVYYMDIINTIRDDFLNDDEQTPHFVSQGTGREKFVAEAANLSGYRKQFDQQWKPDPATSTAVVAANTTSQGMLQLIQEAESHFVAPEQANKFISNLFDGIISQLNRDDFSEFYNIDVVEHNDYEEDTAREFIIRSLSRKKRPDNFVTASITRSRRNVNSLYARIEAGSAGLFGGDEFVEKWNLKLNCSINRAQIKITLEPKFKSLNQIRLVVSCAPSLNSCYIFEISTLHVWRDWDSFDDEGVQIDQDYHEKAWNEDIDRLVCDICDRIHRATKVHVESTIERLAAAKSENDKSEA